MGHHSRRSSLATAGLALGVLVLLSVAGTGSAIHDWLPSTLAGAPADLLAGATLPDFVPAFLVAGAATAALTGFAVHRLDRREL